MRSSRSCTCEGGLPAASAACVAVAHSPGTCWPACAPPPLPRASCPLPSTAPLSSSLAFPRSWLMQISDTFRRLDADKDGKRRRCSFSCCSCRCSGLPGARRGLAAPWPGTPPLVASTPARLPSPALRSSAGALSKGEAQAAVAEGGYRLDPPAFEALFRSFDPDRRAPLARSLGTLVAACAHACPAPACPLSRASRPSWLQDQHAVPGRVHGHVRLSAGGKKRGVQALTDLVPRSRRRRRLSRQRLGPARAPPPPRRSPRLSPVCRARRARLRRLTPRRQVGSQWSLANLCMQPATCCEASPSSAAPDGRLMLT